MELSFHITEERQGGIVSIHRWLPELGGICRIRVLGLCLEVYRGSPPEYEYTQESGDEQTQTEGDSELFNRSTTG